MMLHLVAALTETTPSTAFTIEALLAVVTQLWSTFIGYIGDVIELVTNHPLLLFVMAIPFATIGFSLFGRLLKAVRKVG